MKLSLNTLRSLRAAAQAAERAADLMQATNHFSAIAVDVAAASLRAVEQGLALEIQLAARAARRAAFAGGESADASLREPAAARDTAGSGKSARRGVRRPAHRETGIPSRSKR